MEKEITMEEQVFYLLKNLELIKECGSFWELKEKLIMRDISWGVLKEKLTFSEDFVKQMLHGSESLSLREELKL